MQLINFLNQQYNLSNIVKLKKIVLVTNLTPSELLRLAIINCCQ